MKKLKEELMEETELAEPVSPMEQYLSSSVLSVSLIGVLESDSPIDDSSAIQLINEIFLPINPRFSSVMVEDDNGEKHWKQVKVNVDDHIKVPCFPDGLSLDSYDDCFDDYISEIAMDPFPNTRPLWEIHIIKYPTSNASGSLVFKLHHALGDGYSLMGALLSCLKRADNPSIPLTFPNFRKSLNLDNDIKSLMTLVPQAFSVVLNTVLDFGFGILKGTFLQDCMTPIRSGEEGVEFQPIKIKTMVFSLDQIKHVKANLGVTINDVVAGVIFLGTRLYMEATSNDSGKATSTATVALNTRSVVGYRSVDEMLHNPEAQSLWGNQLSFLNVPLPKLHKLDHSLNPLKFVYEAQNIIKRKRNSSAVYLTGNLLESIRKYRGSEAAATYVYRMAKNSSMSLTNVVGPVDNMTLANHLVKGIYFMPVNVPQSYVVTVISYTNQLRIALGTQKGFVDHLKLQMCITEAYDLIFKAAIYSK